MYRVGSLFYAIYFFVSFPVFFYMDEGLRHSCSLWTAATEALASGMIVTILLDFWKLAFGGFSQGISSGLMWMKGL